MLVKEKRRLEQQIYLRDILYKLLSDDEKIIFEYKFEKRYSVYETVEDMFISESSYYRRLKKIYDKLIKYYDSFEGLFIEK